jgi:hypothetical protein
MKNGFRCDRLIDGPVFFDLISIRVKIFLPVALSLRTIPPIFAAAPQNSMTTKTLSKSDSMIHKPGRNLFAGRMDALSRLLAKKQLGFYVLYSAPAGLSLFYTLIKSTLDLQDAKSNLSTPDEMPEWMMSPGRAVVAAMTFPYIAILWIMKGLKHVYFR